jgi:hypothetical protein
LVRGRSRVAQSLDCFPDPAYCGGAVLKLLDRRHSRQRVPDLDQPGALPGGGEFRERALAGENFGSFRFRGGIRRSENRDVILCVDAKCLHFNLLPRRPLRSSHSLIGFAETASEFCKIVKKSKRGDARACILNQAHQNVPERAKPPPQNEKGVLY